jgi:hypothetical protein
MTISIVMVDTQSHFPSFVGPCRLRTWISQQKRVSGVGQNEPPKILLTAAATAACLSVFYQFLSGLFFLIFLFSLSFHD